MYSVNFDGKLVDLYVSIDTVNMVRFAYNGRWNFMNISMSVWCVGLLCAVVSSFIYLFIYLFFTAVFMSCAAEMPDAQEPSIWCCTGLF